MGVAKLVVAGFEWCCFVVWQPVVVGVKEFVPAVIGVVVGVVMSRPSALDVSLVWYLLVA